MKTLILNSSNVVAGSDNTVFKYVFPNGGYNFKDDYIGVQEVSIYFSAFNITASYSNNSFSYIWVDGTTNVVAIPDKETTIVAIGTSTAQVSVGINGEYYSGTHYMLAKRDNVSKMIASEDLLETDELWSADTNSWAPITELIISYTPHEVISINCEPYDMFYTDRFLVYDGYQIETNF